MNLNNVEVLLRDFVGKDVIFKPNPGNAGDSVIACAEYLMFDRLGLSVKEYDQATEAEIANCDLLIYGGGGNLVGLYQNAAQCISAWHQRVKRLVLLPHTVRGHEALVQSLGPNVTVFCREAESLDYVSSQNPKLDARFEHDMAFSLPMDAVVARDSSLGFLKAAPLNIRTIKRKIRSLLYDLSSKWDRNDLYAFRGDAEGTGRIGRLNIDVSQAFSADDMSKQSCLETTAVMASFLNRYQVIHTDRLHVCIVSALLGKTVRFHDNNYGKNRSVHAATMLKNFPKIELMK
jgi:exopolysaccharide biosynthesis predicted pyruvyltransferase EpsI